MDDLKTVFIMAAIFLFLWMCWYCFGTSNQQEQKKINKISDDDFDF